MHIRLTIVDPGVASANMGDRIISSAVHEHFVRPLADLGHVIARVPMHGALTPDDRDTLATSDEVVVCGTNLLSSHMRYKRAWEWTRNDIELLRGKLTVLGAGWWQYQRLGVDPLSATWLRRLASGRPWAIRDEYSVRRVRNAGIEATHTSCPTLWQVRQQRAPDRQSIVVVTVTDYNQDPVADTRLDAYLNRRFDSVLYWPQGSGDANYIRSIIDSNALLIGSSVEALDGALALPDVAYIGVRLHAGIRAIQLGVPTVVLTIDNRSREIGQSIGLHVASRHRLSRLDGAMDGRTVELNVPTGPIEGWLRGWGIGLADAI